MVSPDSTQTYHLRAFYIDETIEMVQNGNFNLGNVGFTSDYYFCSDPTAKDCKDQKVNIPSIVTQQYWVEVSMIVQA